MINSYKLPNANVISFYVTCYVLHVNKKFEIACTNKIENCYNIDINI